MCGIVGRVNLSREKPVQEEELRLATRVIAHRGPDGEGLWLGPGVGLGHRRLSIVDLAGGAQPMANEPATLQVVFNGEIYNHEALRQELQARGHRFRTRSDTEVLLHGYQAWGEELPQRLRGMFAFALWDARRERLFVARDRVGIKPLYWTRTPGGDLLFASEAKSLFAFADVPRELDPSQVPTYLALRYVPGTRTMFRGIDRLEPGHSLTFERGTLRRQRYWDVPVEGGGGRGGLDEAEEADRLEQLLRETTRMHLMGEVPVGLFLSGGIDSTAVGWAMRAAGASRLKTFSVGFAPGPAAAGPTPGDDELGWARIAARSLGSEHHEVRITAEQFHASLGELVWHLDEPNADGACIPLMHLARRAREEVVVVLSGEGADEILGGYGIYRKLLALEQARRRGGAWVRAVAGLASRAVKDARVRKYLGMLGRPLPEHYFGVGRGFTDELLLETFGPSALHSLAATFAPLWERTREAPPLHQLLYADTRIWLPDDLLVKADKMTMSSAIELRVPFLDHVMLENAWRLPPSMKLRRGVGKHLLRRALAGRIPAEILNRPKKGFPVPIGGWLRTTLHEPLRDRLLASGSAARQFVGSRTLTRLLDEHRRGVTTRTEELYSLWVFEEWHRAWVSGRRTPTHRNTLKVPDTSSETSSAERMTGLHGP